MAGVGPRCWLVAGSTGWLALSIDPSYRRIWTENWVDGGGVGITICNEPRKMVLTSIPISGEGVGNAAG